MNLFSFHTKSVYLNILNAFLFTEFNSISGGFICDETLLILMLEEISEGWIYPGDYISFY